MPWPQRPRRPAGLCPGGHRRAEHDQAHALRGRRPRRWRRITAGSTANEAPNAAAAEAASAAEAAIEDIEHALPVETEPADAEPIPLDAEGAATLDRRMGEWIIAACKDKRLAFALAFPFVRRPLALDAVRATSVQNAGVGVVVFIPGADMPIMTLNQAKMLLQIAAAYNQPLSAERIKELAAVVGGRFCSATSRARPSAWCRCSAGPSRGPSGSRAPRPWGTRPSITSRPAATSSAWRRWCRRPAMRPWRPRRGAAATPAGGKVIEAARGAGASASVPCAARGRALAREAPVAGDLWPPGGAFALRVERPARYLNHEWGCAAPVAEGDFAFCMIYPDTYELGQANQAVRILVNAVNAMGGMGAERAFLPAVDMADLMREEGVPLFSLESCRPVAGFDVVGITRPTSWPPPTMLPGDARSRRHPAAHRRPRRGRPHRARRRPVRQLEPYAGFFFRRHLGGRGARSSCPRRWRSSTRAARVRRAPGRYPARGGAARGGRLRAESVPLAQRG